MPDALAAQSPTPSFGFIAGDPALDFVNTVDWTDAGQVDERLTYYDALVRWSVEAGLLPRSAGDRLRRTAAARPREARAALAHAIRTRAVLHEVFIAVAGGRRPGPALRELNALVGDAMGRLVLSDSLRWEWRDAGHRLDAVLWPVIRSAAELLASSEVGQIRVCGGPACGWMFVDRSRNGLRRWCQMRTCGTREKTRRRRV
jgi:predicted RNA-binding Zn ribbon-like protein